MKINIDGYSMELMTALENRKTLGYEVQAVIRRKLRDRDTMTIEYRLYKNGEYWVITKYQAKKYLSDSQKANIELFESILKEDREVKNRCFGRKLDLINKRKAERETDVRLDTALIVLEQGKLTYL